MIENPYVLFLVMPLVAYVIGSTPFGVIIARYRGVDLRASGSGNVGATNVGRVLGRRWGYLCFALDVAKGFVPVLATVLLVPIDQVKPDVGRQVSWLLVGCGAIVGHVLPFWLRFRGGKGVATALGVVLGIYPYFTLAGLSALGVWIVVTLISRYVSLGSIVAALAFVPLFLAWGRKGQWHIEEFWPMGLFALAMVALIIVRHRSNIRRLVAGTEHRIGERKEPAQATEEKKD